MGILNVTPDSFFDGGTYCSANDAIKHGIEIYEQGADYIDIGGESTRPGSKEVSTEEELRRVIPVIRALKKEVPIPLSIDTKKPEVAKQAVAHGVSLVNDISGLCNPEMRALVADSKVRVCVMHMQNHPETMQQNPSYNHVMDDLVAWFENRIELLLNDGIKKEQIIIDPGIGFGKTVAHNVQILQNLKTFSTFDLPILLGASRKSFISKILNKESQDLLSGTLAVNTLALMNGAHYIRVHDIIPHRDTIDVISAIQNQN